MSFIACSRAVPLLAVGSSRLPASHSAYFRSVHRADSGMPENRPQCGLIKTPRALEIGAGLFEGRGGVGLMFPRMRVRIEAAALFPRIGVMGISHALGNRPGVNIAVVNVPAVITVVCGAERRRVSSGVGLRVCQSQRRGKGTSRLNLFGARVRSIAFSA
jgi:hypothetical protein